MSESMKCPMGCGGNLVNARVSEVAFECTQCYFRCHKGHLPRIAAAMELGKAEVKLLDSIQAYAGYDQALIDRTKARERVLEVFNG